MFVEYFEYVRGLQFDEKPDYNYVKGLFKKLMTQNNYYFDFLFDWSSSHMSLQVSYINCDI